MSQIAPPLPPARLITHADGDPLRRLKLRLWQVLATTVTVLVTGWFCTFGILSAIIALMIAKHILVAILVFGMETD